MHECTTCHKTYLKIEGKIQCELEHASVISMFSCEKCQFFTRNGNTFSRHNKRKHQAISLSTTVDRTRYLKEISPVKYAVFIKKDDPYNYAEYFTGKTTLGKPHVVSCNSVNGQIFKGEPSYGFGKKSSRKNSKGADEQYIVIDAEFEDYTTKLPVNFLAYYFKTCTEQVYEIISKWLVLADECVLTSYNSKPADNLEKDLITRLEEVSMYGFRKFEAYEVGVLFGRCVDFEDAEKDLLYLDQLEFLDLFSDSDNLGQILSDPETLSKRQKSGLRQDFLLHALSDDMKHTLGILNVDYRWFDAKFRYYA